MKLERRGERSRGKFREFRMLKPVIGSVKTSTQNCNKLQVRGLSDTFRDIVLVSKRSSLSIIFVMRLFLMLEPIPFVIHCIFIN